MKLKIKLLLLLLTITEASLNPVSLERIMLEQQCEYLEEHLFHDHSVGLYLARKNLQAGIAAIISWGIVALARKKIHRWLAPDIKILHHDDEVELQAHTSAAKILLRAAEEKLCGTKAPPEPPSQTKSASTTSATSQMSGELTGSSLLTYAATCIPIAVMVYKLCDRLFASRSTDRERLIRFIQNWPTHKPNIPVELHNEYELIAGLYEHDNRLNDLSDVLISEIITGTRNYIHQICQEVD